MLRYLPLLLLLACDAAPVDPPAQDAEIFPDFGPRPDLGAPGPAAGEPCHAEGPACAVGVCLHGTCSPLCTEDADCPATAARCVARGGTRRCTPACAGPSDCAPGLTCAVLRPDSGFCVAPGEGRGGEDCATREACATWFCSEGSCLGACEAGQCPEGRSCLDLYTQSVCVDVGPSPDEAACRGGPECASGLCRGGRCSQACSVERTCPDDRTCVQYEALGLCERRCESSTDCGETGFCQATTAGRLCATRGVGGGGVACVSGADCASGRCQNQVCAAACGAGPCPAGQACVRDVVGAACRAAGPGVSGAPCGQGAECASGVCGGGICTTDCAEGRRCPVGTRCTRFVDGDICFPPCRVDGDCPENAFCDVGFAEGPTCFWRGLGAAEAACVRDGDCASGACASGRCLGRCPDGVCPGERTCRDFGTAPLCAPEPLPEGAACEANDVCGEGLGCASGRCLPGCDRGCPVGTVCYGRQCHPGCAQDLDCRPGRPCNAFDGEAAFCQSPGARPAGAACRLSGECAAGLCFEGRCRADCVAGGCPANQACVPLGVGAFCLAAGAGEAAAPCGMGSDCQGGLCVGRRCAEPCVDGNCPGGTLCRGLRGGAFCVVECDLVSGLGCLAGEECAPADDGSGRCALPAGGAEIGEPCTRIEDCAVTAVACFGAGDGLRCRSACDLDGSTCPAEAVCAPHDPTLPVGACVPPGDGQDMAPCRQAGDCASGWCITAYLDGHCGRACDSDAACGAGSRCVDLARNPSAPLLSCAPRCLADADCPQDLRCRRGLSPGGACY